MDPKDSYVPSILREEIARLSAYIEAEKAKALVLVEENKKLVEKVEQLRAERDARPDISPNLAGKWLPADPSTDPTYAIIWIDRKLRDALREHAARKKHLPVEDTTPVSQKDAALGAFVRLKIAEFGEHPAMKLHEFYSEICDYASRKEM